MAMRAICSFGIPASISFSPVTLSDAANAIWRGRGGVNKRREGCMSYIIHVQQLDVDIYAHSTYNV